MGLCVCTQRAVMRLTAVQMAKWNPNKRSHVTLMTLSAGQRKALTLAQRTTEKCSVRALILLSLTPSNTRPHALPYNITLPHTTAV